MVVTAQDGVGKGSYCQVQDRGGKAKHMYEIWEKVKRKKSKTDK